MGADPFGIAITPDGKTAYVTSADSGTVTPIAVAANTPGTPIPVGSGVVGIAITPDGTTAYVTNSSRNTVTPIAVATNTPGTPIEFPAGSWTDGIAITPDGTTAYVINAGSSTVMPINLATNTPGTPIPGTGKGGYAIAITPDGKTVYVANEGSSTVTPIAVATNTPGTPIPVGTGPFGIAITPTPRATSTQLSANPSTPAPSGTQETLTATVSPSAAGSVQFKDGTATLGDPVTVFNGTASMTTTLSSGIHPLTAVFIPTNIAAFNSSTAPAVTYVVNDPQPTLTTTTLTTSPAGSVDLGTSVTLNAAVSPVAAGSVQFKDGDSYIGTPATVTNGAASITTSSLTAGSHQLTAVFTPTNTAAFIGSTSPAVTFMVNAPSGAKATTTTLTVFPHRAFQGIPVIFLANVAPRGAIGIVQFMDGPTALGAPVPVFGGFALTITTLPKGMHSLSAVFTATDPAAFAPSTSSPVLLTVNPLLSRVPLR